jgi:hypothetical protein
MSPKTTKSGEHPAVKDYLRKLDSIETSQGGALEELDRELDEYLRGVRSTPPPPPEPK